MEGEKKYFDGCMEKSQNYDSGRKVETRRSDDFVGGMEGSESMDCVGVVGERNQSFLQEKVVTAWFR